MGDVQGGSSLSGMTRQSYHSLVWRPFWEFDDHADRTGPENKYTYIQLRGHSSALFWQMVSQTSIFQVKVLYHLCRICKTWFGNPLLFVELEIWRRRKVVPKVRELCGAEVFPSLLHARKIRADGGARSQWGLQGIHSEYCRHGEQGLISQLRNKSTLRGWGKERWGAWEWVVFLQRNGSTAGNGPGVLWKGIPLRSTA